MDTAISRYSDHAYIEILEERVSEAVFATLLPVASLERSEVDGGVVSDPGPDGILQVHPMVLVDRLATDI